MNHKNAIEVNHLKKQYYIAESRSEYPTLREAIGNFFSTNNSRRHGEWLRAINDISFTIKQGEQFGIIGLNGAGKSTLLKILSRIVIPTDGNVYIKGRVASLLELGTGFHPDLSGRENIFLNGMMLGMTRNEVRVRYKKIVDFSEIGHFLETPIKYYSSGMQARLGFSIAAHLDSEILIVDEVLSVGDYTFHKKCIARMHEICKSGKTILFVSHNMQAVADICTQGMVLAAGKIAKIGKTDECIAFYTQAAQLYEHSTWQGDMGNEKFRINEFKLDRKQSNTIINTRTPLKLIISYKILKPIKNLIIATELINAKNETVAISRYADHTNTYTSPSTPGQYTMTLSFSFKDFTDGVYKMVFWAGPHNGQYILQKEPAITINVSNKNSSLIHHANVQFQGYAHPQNWKWGML